MNHPAEWAAVGDSFTAGTGDDPYHGGWIPRAAAALKRSGKIAGFCNHSEPGVRLDDVLESQVPCVKGHPRVISAIAGANDILERRCSLPAVTDRADQLLDWALSKADIVLTCTCPDFFAGRPQLRRLSSRVDSLNRRLEQRRRDAPDLVVVDAHRILANRGLWADDGIHPNPHGHTQLAKAATEILSAALT